MLSIEPEMVSIILSTLVQSLLNTSISGANG